MSNTFTTKDGTTIYYKDWGTGPVVSFSHGWPLSSDAWEAQMFFLASNGYRCIAHDRRGHGRSSQPWNGNDMDTYADDLTELFTKLDLKSVTMVGHSTGGGEVARYIGRHGTKRVAQGRADGRRAADHAQDRSESRRPADGSVRRLPQAYLADRAQFFLDVASGPFFGFNRPGAKVSQGLIQSWWLQGMMSGHKNGYDCIKAFSETDFHRGPEEDRRADADHPWRRRPDRADRRIGDALVQTGEGLDAEDLPGRHAQPGRHEQGPAQR
jgi:non-heme chloroperoxidase